MDSYQNTTEEMMQRNTEILESYKNKFQNIIKIDFGEIGDVIRKLKNVTYDPKVNMNVPVRLIDYLDCSKKFIF